MAMRSIRVGQVISSRATVCVLALITPWLCACWTTLSQSGRVHEEPEYRTGSHLPVRDRDQARTESVAPGDINWQLSPTATKPLVPQNP
jgi:hypothetical protein